MKELAKIHVTVVFVLYDVCFSTHDYLCYIGEDIHA